jgi:hypothetical protein
MTAVVWLLAGIGAVWGVARALAWGYLAAAGLFIGWWSRRVGKIKPSLNAGQARFEAIHAGR